MFGDARKKRAAAQAQAGEPVAAAEAPPPPPTEAEAAALLAKLDREIAAAAAAEAAAPGAAAGPLRLTEQPVRVRLLEGLGAVSSSSEDEEEAEVGLPGTQVRIVEVANGTSARQSPKKQLFGYSLRQSEEHREKARALWVTDRVSALEQLTKAAAACPPTETGMLRQLQEMMMEGAMPN